MKQSHGIPLPAHRPMEEPGISQGRKVVVEHPRPHLALSQRLSTSTGPALEYPLPQETQFADGEEVGDLPEDALQNRAPTTRRPKDVEDLDTSRLADPHRLGLQWSR